MAEIVPITTTDLTRSPFVRLQARLSKESVRLVAQHLRDATTKVTPAHAAALKIGVMGLTMVLGVAAGAFGGMSIAADIQSVVESPVAQLAAKALGAGAGMVWGSLVATELVSKPADALPTVIRSTRRDYKPPAAKAA